MLSFERSKLETNEIEVVGDAIKDYVLKNLNFFVPPPKGQEAYYSLSRFKVEITPFCKNARHMFSYYVEISNCDDSSIVKLITIDVDVNVFDSADIVCNLNNIEIVNIRENFYCIKMRFNNRYYFLEELEEKEEGA